MSTANPVSVATKLLATNTVTLGSRMDSTLQSDHVSKTTIGACAATCIMAVLEILRVTQPTILT